MKKPPTAGLEQAMSTSASTVSTNTSGSSHRDQTPERRGAHKSGSSTSRVITSTPFKATHRPGFSAAQQRKRVERSSDDSSVDDKRPKTEKSPPLIPPTPLPRTSASPKPMQAEVIMLSAPASPSPSPTRGLPMRRPTIRAPPPPSSTDPPAATASYAAALRSPPQPSASSPTGRTPQKQAAPATTTERKSYPPIVVSAIPDWPHHLGELRRRLGHVPNARPLDKGIRFRPKSAEEFRAVQKYLIEAQQVTPGIAWHCYALESEKPHKVALWGLPEGTEPELIKRALQDLDFPVSFVRALPKRKNARKSVYFIQLANMSKDQLARLYNTDELLNMPRVEIEGWRGGTTVPQCHRCQQFGHASANCHRPQQCVKCAGPHPGSECPKEAGAPSLCANCQGSHAANSRQCPVFRREARKRNIRIPGDFRAPAQQQQRPHDPQPNTHQPLAQQRGRRAPQSGTAAGQEGPTVPTPALRTRAANKPQYQVAQVEVAPQVGPVTTLRPPANMPGESVPRKRSRKRGPPAKKTNTVPILPAENPPTRTLSARVPRSESRGISVVRGGQTTNKETAQRGLERSSSEPSYIQATDLGSGGNLDSNWRDICSESQANRSDKCPPHAQEWAKYRDTIPLQKAKENQQEFIRPRPDTGVPTKLGRATITKIVEVLVELISALASGEDPRNAKNVARAAAAIQLLYEERPPRNARGVSSSLRPAPLPSNITSGCDAPTGNAGRSRQHSPKTTPGGLNPPSALPR